MPFFTLSLLEVQLMWRTSVPSLSLRVPNPSQFLSLSDHRSLLTLPNLSESSSGMLCSARPAGRSGSNWLDRLRSNKGIPTGDNLSLDYFLATHSDSPHSSSDPTPQERVPNRTRESEIPAAVPDPPMSSVLAELFNMGGSLIRSSKLPGKKCPRKQSRPKFFDASSSSNSSIDSARKDDNVPTTSSFNSDAVVVKDDTLGCGVAAAVVAAAEDEEENDKDGHDELRGFSKSEVTVIDTSCPGWKVDKLVFRKNNVWKVRERKGKSRFFAKKKSKAKPPVNGGGAGEHKPFFFEHQFGTSSETNREQFIAPSTQGQYTQHERREACEDTQDDLRPPLKKRQVHLQAAGGY